MLLPLAVGFLAVSFGALLALGTRQGARATMVIRVVALLAALLVIAAHLVPEAVHALGAPTAIVWLLCGAALPSTIQLVLRVAIRSKPAADERARAIVALELGYIGLAVHRFGDGLSMGAAHYATTSRWAELAVLLAFAAHIVPVTAVMLLAIKELRGQRSALSRAAGLLVATLSGVVAVGIVGARDEEPLPWVSALVAGLLLHVVSHELPRRGGAAPAPAPEKTT